MLLLWNTQGDSTDKNYKRSLWFVKKLLTIKKSCSINDKQTQFRGKEREKLVCNKYNQLIHMEGWHVYKQMVIHEKRRETEQETAICSLRSHTVINSWKDGEQTEDSENRYHCLAVICAIRCSLIFAESDLYITLWPLTHAATNPVTNVTMHIFFFFMHEIISYLNCYLMTTKLVASSRQCKFCIRFYSGGCLLAHGGCCCGNTTRSGNMSPTREVRSNILETVWERRQTESESKGHSESRTNRVGTTINNSF